MEENTSKNTYFPTGKGELRMLIAMAVCCVLMADAVIYGGFNLGFALLSIVVSSLSFLYLRKGGQKNGYAAALYFLTLVLGASFLRSDDDAVKFVLLCFLMTGGNLAMALTAGQNRRDPGKLASLLDAPMALFSIGLGQMSNALGGINEARKNAGESGKKNMAVLAGLAIAVPVMAVLIPLLIRADAAFEGLVALLPEWDLSEPIAALLIGIPLTCVLYARNTGLKYRPKAEADTRLPRYISSLTVNTVLICVGLLYLVYLLSQLAYFVGGFSGILPEEFTMAEYARRGFFEMAWLTGLNLGIIVLSAALTQPQSGKLPGATRFLCLFIGLVTIFFAAAASAKMFLYIGAYGLTRLRLLVQVIIIFILLTVVYVAIWLFKPRFSYMKAVMLTAMVLCACVSWTDVDTVVAAYNVRAYQSGRLQSVDVRHLSELGSGAVPYLQILADSDDPIVAAQAKASLSQKASHLSDLDLRGWNIADVGAQRVLIPYYLEEQAQEQVQEQTQEEFRLARLPDHTDIRSCEKMTELYREIFHEGDCLTLYFKDEELYYPDGEPFDLCPFDYGALLFMADTGVSTLEVTDSYILFRTDMDMSRALLWSPDPHSAAILQTGDATWYSLGNEWYILEMA